MRPVKILTTAECAEKWHVSQRWVAQCCEDGRISGAIKKGKTWLIPGNTLKPLDKRSFKKKQKEEEEAIRLWEKWKR